MTIIILAHNEFEYAKTCVECIRMFAEDPDTKVILVDNGSSDGLYEWGCQQRDITFVWMEDGMEPYGKCLNQVIRGLQIDEMFLVIEPHMLITSDMTDRMMAALATDEYYGAMGPISNSFFLSDQRMEEEVESYQKADMIEKHIAQHVSYQQMIGIEKSAVMYRKSIWEQVDGFDDQLQNLRSVTRDFFLRLHCEGYKVGICKNAFIYGLRTEIEEPSDLLQSLDTDEKHMEQKWGLHYFNLQGNHFLADMIERDNEDSFQVMEIGCDLGATLLLVKHRYPNVKVYGCELNENAVKLAGHYLDAAIVLNIEKDDPPFENGSMDYIILGDVLEHLHNPLQTLVKLRKFLKKEGYIAASIPNLMHISVMKQLLKGEFTYTETGLLDRTHIHFFTWKEIKKLFEEADFSILNSYQTVKKLDDEDDSLIDQLIEIGNGTQRYMYEAFQYGVLAKKEE